MKKNLDYHIPIEVKPDWKSLRCCASSCSWHSESDDFPRTIIFTYVCCHSFFSSRSVTTKPTSRTTFEIFFLALFWCNFYVSLFFFVSVRIVCSFRAVLDIAARIFVYVRFPNVRRDSEPGCLRDRIHRKELSRTNGSPEHRVARSVPCTAAFVGCNTRPDRAAILSSARQPVCMAAKTKVY